MSFQSFLYYQTHDQARLRYAYYPSRTSVHHCRGTVVLFQGRASFIEKFTPITQELTRQGFHVWTFDWRGQGLSSRQLKDPHRGHIDSYETYLSDFHNFFTDVIADHVKGPLILLGQSMGCQIGLRYLERHPDTFDMALLTAPMLELNTGGYKPSVARFFANTMCRLGFSDAYVVGHGSYNPSKEPFEGNMLTHDRDSFAAHRELQKANPDLLIGGVTYGWVKASFDSIEILNTPESLGKIQVPVLLITAGEEVVVENKNIPTLTSWLPQGEHIIYEGARHQILSESPTYMKRFWEDFFAFVSKNEKGYNPGLLAKRRFVKPSQLSGMKRVYPTLPNDFNGLKSNF